MAIFYSYFFYSDMSNDVLVSFVSSWLIEDLRSTEVEEFAIVYLLFIKELHFNYFYFLAFSYSILAFHLISSSFLNSILACFWYRIYQST